MNPPPLPSSKTRNKLAMALVAIDQNVEKTKNKTLVRRRFKRTTSISTNVWKYTSSTSWISYNWKQQEEK